MRLNRATGDAFAEGDVKSTYSDLKAQPNGALLASSDPIHVTARTMTAHSSPAVALYTGEARLWQDANVIRGAFDRVRSQSAVGGCPGNADPDRVSRCWCKRRKVEKLPRSRSPQLASATPTTSAKRILREECRPRERTSRSPRRTMDVFLQPRDQATTNQSLAGTGKIDRIRCPRTGSDHPAGAQGAWRSADLHRRRRQVRADGRFA